MTHIGTFHPVGVGSVFYGYLPPDKSGGYRYIVLSGRIYCLVGVPTPRNNPFERQKQREKPLQQADYTINPLIALQKAAPKVSNKKFKVPSLEVEGRNVPLRVRCGRLELP